MADKHLVELSDKELYLCWVILCWFNAPVTTTLKCKFSALASSDLRYKFDEKFEAEIENQLINNGAWLDDYRKKNPR